MKSTERVVMESVILSVESSSGVPSVSLVGSDSVTDSDDRSISMVASAIMVGP